MKASIFSLILIILTSTAFADPTELVFILELDVTRDGNSSTTQSTLRKRFSTSYWDWSANDKSLVDVCEENLAKTIEELETVLLRGVYNEADNSIMDGGMSLDDLHMLYGEPNRFSLERYGVSDFSNILIGAAYGRIAKNSIGNRNFYYNPDFFQNTNSASQNMRQVFHVGPWAFRTTNWLFQERRLSLSNNDVGKVCEILMDRAERFLK